MVISTKRKKKSKEIVKNKKQKTVNPLERLEKLTASNYFVTFEKCSSEEYSSIQKFMQDHLHIKEISIQEYQDNQSFMAFNSQVDLQNKSEHFGVIIGPNAEKEFSKVILIFFVICMMIKRLKLSAEIQLSWC